MNHIYLKTIFALVIKEPNDNKNSNLDYRVDRSFHIESGHWKPIWKGNICTLPKMKSILDRGKKNILKSRAWSMCENMLDQYSSIRMNEGEGKGTSKT